MSTVNRGFGRRRRPVDPEIARRIPPGQHLVPDFPVLTVGPTPRRELRDWSFRIDVRLRGLARPPRRPAGVQDVHARP